MTLYNDKSDELSFVTVQTLLVYKTVLNCAVANGPGLLESHTDTTPAASQETSLEHKLHKHTQAWITIAKRKWSFSR